MRYAAVCLWLAVVVTAGCGRGSPDSPPVVPPEVLSAVAEAVPEPQLPVAPPPRRAGPRRETFERVRQGMSRDEVIRTVGGPPGEYLPAELRDRVLLSARGLGYQRYDQWVTEEGELLVRFGRDGLAYDIRVWDVTIPRP
jgi:hypothetical protein